MKALIVALILLIAHAASAAGVRLAWDAPVTDLEISGYRVYYGTEPGVYPVEGCEVASTSCEVTDLDECWTYHFVATAYNEAGESDPSESVSYTVPGSCGTSGVAVEPDQEFIEEEVPTSAPTIEPIEEPEAQPTYQSPGGGGCFIGSAF